MAVEAVCKICNKEFAKKLSLRGHLQKYHAGVSEAQNLPAFACPYCSKSLPYQFDLNRHIKLLHCNPYRCIIPLKYLKPNQPQCNANFRTLSKFMFHVCAVHQDALPKAALREIIVSNAEPVTKIGDFAGGISTLPKGPAVCPFEGCHARYNNLLRHSTHVGFHAGGKYECSFCHVKFIYHKQLNDHLKDPSTVPCHKSYLEMKRSAESLMRENKRHYICEICNRVLADATDYARHKQRKHTKPFIVCEVCGFQTRIKDVMRRHKQREAKKLEKLNMAGSPEPKKPRLASDADGSVDSQTLDTDSVTSDTVDTDNESIVVCIEPESEGSPRPFDYSSSPIVCIPSHFSSPSLNKRQKVEAQIKEVFQRIALFDDESYSDQGLDIPTPIPQEPVVNVVSREVMSESTQTAPNFGELDSNCLTLGQADAADKSAPSYNHFCECEEDIFVPTALCTADFDEGESQSSPSPSRNESMEGVLADPVNSDTPQAVAEDEFAALMLADMSQSDDPTPTHPDCVDVIETFPMIASNEEEPALAEELASAEEPAVAEELPAAEEPATIDLHREQESYFLVESIETTSPLPVGESNGQFVSAVLSLAKEDNLIEPAAADTPIPDVAFSHDLIQNEDHAQSSREAYAEMEAELACVAGDISTTAHLDSAGAADAGISIASCHEEVTSDRNQGCSLDFVES